MKSFYIVYCLFCIIFFLFILTWICLDREHVPSSGLEWTPLKRDAVCVEYRCEDIVSWSDVGVIPLLIGVSPGRKITEKLPVDELFITPASSDGDEHDSDFVSRNKGDPLNSEKVKRTFYFRIFT